MSKIGVFITMCLFIMMIFFPFLVSNEKSNNVDLSTKETITGNKYRIDYVDDKGIVTIDPAKGYSTMIQIRDADGNAVEEYYYNTKQKPVMCSSGYYGVRRIYQDGICVEYTLVDQDGNPMKGVAGYSTIKQIYNNKNQVVEVYYYDKEDNQVALSLGQYGEQREYDVDGNNYITIYIDALGNPIENNKGYSTVRREYNKDGQITYEWFYNLDGEQVDIGRGQYGTLRIYEDGKYVESVPIDINGHEQFFLDRLLSKSPWLVGITALILVMITILLNLKGRIALFICYILFILYMTLFIREIGSKRYEFELFWSYRQFFESPELGLEVLNNIWLFVPFGAILHSLKKKQQMLLLAIGLSVFIEGMQYFFGLGLCELDDVIGNSLGAWFGWCCFYEGIKLRYKIVKPTICDR